ncbi:MAG: RidA family protein, partial [Dermatophilaceae bacterium]|nr:RidA family protein [Dermatophilaceae bacterium]
MSHRQPVTAPDAPKPAGPYSHAVRSGGVLYCSGQVPIDPGTGS